MVDRIKPEQLKAIVDGALLAAGEPLSVDRLAKLFKLGELHPKEGRNHIREALKELEQENSRLKKLLAEAQLDKEILQEALKGNY